MMAEGRTDKQQSRVTKDNVTILSASLLIVDWQSKSDQQNEESSVCFQVDLLIVQASETFPKNFS